MKRFKEASEAYAVLADGDKRAATTASATPVSPPTEGGGFDETVFHDFPRHSWRFLRLRYLRRPRRRGPTPHPCPTRRRSPRGSKNLEFERGRLSAREKTVTVRRHETCEALPEVPAPAPGKSPSPPAAPCNGHGQVRHQQGFFSIARNLFPPARGLGQVITDPCLQLPRAGKSPSPTLSRSQSPRGRRRWNAASASPALGEAGPFGGQPGDLYVPSFTSRSMPFFEREGNDLRCVVPISLVQATPRRGNHRPPRSAATKRSKFPKAHSPARPFASRIKGVPRPQRAAAPEISS